MSYNPTLAPGQNTSSASSPVVLATDQTSIPVTMSTIGQAVGASSVPVVLASNQTTSVSTTWFANVAGTGYSIGNILSQVIQNDAGTVRTTWFNLTTSAIIVAPTITNLSLYNNTQSYKSNATWYVGGSSIVNSTGNMLVVRNTYGFPVKVVSFSISMANNSYANSSSAQIMGVGFTLIIGSTTIVGGSGLRNATKLVSSTYSNDSSITSQIGVTSITGGSQFDLGSLVISCPAIGPQTSVSDNGPGPADITLLKGIIIPENSTLLVSGISVGSMPGNPAGLFNCVLTEEL